MRVCCVLTHASAWSDIVAQRYHVDSCSQHGLQELLTAIVHGSTLLYGPLVVVLDDLHLFDTASWQLLANITQHAPAVLVVAALRPNDGMLAPSISPDVSWPSGAAAGLCA